MTESDSLMSWPGASSGKIVASMKCWMLLAEGTTFLDARGRARTQPSKSRRAARQSYVADQRAAISAEPVYLFRPELFRGVQRKRTP